MTPIAQAVQPLKAQAQAAAREQAQKRIDWARKVLAEAGFDMEVAAPCPKSNIGREAYKQAMARRDFLKGIVARESGLCRRFGEPDIVAVDEERAAMVIANWEQMAGASFESFVAKLEGKVGEHAAASMLVDGTWAYSLVEVTKPDGTVQRWKTQMIVNTSSLGTLFNQWPTRLVK